MKDLISHIEYLLHTHNCVIVPGLGGFVLNTLPSVRSGVAEFDSPGYELVFNRDLTHNDGLLSESYMKVYDCSFEKATQRVEMAAHELRNELQQKGRVEMGKLGAFVMHDDRRFVYESGDFVRPDVFGLTNVALKPIIQIQPAVAAKETTSRKTTLRKVGIGTAVAAVIALVFFIFPFNNSTRGLQNAQILSEIFHKSNESQSVTRPVTPQEVVVTANPAPEISQPTPEMAPESTVPTTEVVLLGDSKKYYIVVGVYQFPEGASKAIESLKAEGFTNVGSMPRAGRTDVFVESFADKTEAYTFVREIHKNYPNHRDAWVLKY